MDPERLRRERIADVEGTGRLANEQIARAAPESWGRDGDVALRCECGNDVCHEPLRVPRDVYERVRGDAMLFLVRPGHDVPEAEDVVERDDRFWIVRKHEDVRPVVEESDPRS
jgi:hypothetical protein